VLRGWESRDVMNVKRSVHVYTHVRKWPGEGGTAPADRTWLLERRPQPTARRLRQREWRPRAHCFPVVPRVGRMLSGTLRSAAPVPFVASRP
jgi:hypothetical protein